MLVEADSLGTGGTENAKDSARGALDTRQDALDWRTRVCTSWGVTRPILYPGGFDNGTKR